MSIEAVNWAFTQNIEPSTRKFILVAIAKYADDHGYCWPSQAALAKDVGCGVISVRRHLAQLEKDRFIKREARGRENGGRTSDGYTLPVEQDGKPINLAKRSPVNGNGVAKRSPVNSSNRSPVNASNRSPVNGHESSVESSKERKKERESAPPKRILPEDSHPLIPRLALILKKTNEGAAEFLAEQIELHGWGRTKRIFAQFNTRYSAGEAMPNPGRMWCWIADDIAKQHKPRLISLY
jgi:hypothetical protein